MIAVIGLGFVGLTTALGFSFKKKKVYGFDADKGLLRSLGQGKCRIQEPFLEKILRRELGKNFFAVESLKEAVRRSRVIFFCVGTPDMAATGEADLSHLLRAVQDVLSVIDKGVYKTLVVKSSVPPSSTDEIIKPFIEQQGFKVGKDVGLVCNPEFLREGSAWLDFIKPDRIILGEMQKRDGDILEKLYKPFAAPVVRVSLNTAEFIKYLSNALLSNLISFSNEMSMMAGAIGGIDIKKAFLALHQDRRWSGKPAAMTTYVYPGCGFGGYCLPKDTRALRYLSRKKGFEPLMIDSALLVNDKIKEHVCCCLEESLSKQDCLGVLGLSFKAESDDVRGTPAKDIIELFLKKGFKKIVAYDPQACDNFRTCYDLPIEYAKNMDQVFKKARKIVILTGWKEFKNKIRPGVKDKVLDFRYIL